MVDGGIDIIFGRNLTRLKPPIEAKDRISRKDIDILLDQIRKTSTLIRL